MGNELDFIFLLINPYFPYQPQLLYIFPGNNHNPIHVAFAAMGVFKSGIPRLILKSNRFPISEDL